MQPDLTSLLAQSAARHSHLCPRQVLGVRIGLAGLAAVGLAGPAVDKAALVIVETDGCFVDGVEAATGCSPGRRTLRIEDYGKIAAVVVNVKTGQTVRLAPKQGIRQRADWLIPETSSHYAAMLQAYQVMPAEELLRIIPVRLARSVEALISQAGLRAVCSRCREEISNQRERIVAGEVLCQACADGAYYLA